MVELTRSCHLAATAGSCLIERVGGAVLGRVWEQQQHAIPPEWTDKKKILRRRWSRFTSGGDVTVAPNGAHAGGKSPNINAASGDEAGPQKSVFGGLALWYPRLSQAAFLPCFAVWIDDSLKLRLVPIAYLGKAEAWFSGVPRRIA